ncbi:hypothetical protein CI109_102744 [Kwoniella shandongensis]|uniref:Uncharacterized protein n=1 Tax=Kwoniella shandongensis TaxID=1734106 RepID=A0A5M6BX43_9TREE|nr:uncharacterized protein CI109_004933 [Kwoniella shandongensis]KAA5526730.1 hypothetical protein CI109_004933 [Kwoniella shandongensis]
MAPPTDFSSAQYWSSRFESETSFEWLVPTSTLIPIIDQCLESVKSCLRNDKGGVSVGDGGRPVEQGSQEEGAEQDINILHLGCGTSSLSSLLYEYLTERQGRSTPSDDKETQLAKASSPGGRYRIHDTDYVTPPTLPPPPIQFHLIDLLDSSSLSAAATLISSTPGIKLSSTDPINADSGGEAISPSEIETGDDTPFNLIIDKSTSDAISCSSPLPILSHDPKAPTDPVHRLVYNLSRVVPKGGRWLSVSYSDSRYDFLPSSLEQTKTDMGQKGECQLGWRVVKKEMVATTYIPGGRRVGSGKEERIVYEPETGVWAYILERI